MHLVFGVPVGVVGVLGDCRCSEVSGGLERESVESRGGGGVDASGDVTSE